MRERTRNPDPKGSASMVCLLFVYIITLPLPIERGDIDGSRKKQVD
jgi:hypothetical protein